MNKDNVFINPDVIEDCLSECFDAFEKQSHVNTSANTSEAVETA